MGEFKNIRSLPRATHILSHNNQDLQFTLFEFHITDQEKCFPLPSAQL